jgi:hypothetical protein
LILLLLFYGWSCDCTSCINGKSRVERPLPYETIRLPLNPMECVKQHQATHQAQHQVAIVRTFAHTTLA